ATGTYGTFTIDPDTAAWQFTLNQEAADHLAEGTSATQTFTATVTDDFGATATEVVTITITGTNDSPVITVGGNTGDTVEAGNLDIGTVVPGTPTASGTLSSSDVDDGATATWTGNATGTYGTFTIDPDTAAWQFTLNQEAADHLAEGMSATQTFTATVTDDF